jgi:DNA mismatch repair protein MutS
MYVDAITRADLHLFQSEETGSVFHRLNFTRTDGGREQLRLLFEQPLSDRQKIESRQQLLLRIGDALNEWPQKVTNGTMHAVEKWLDYPLDPVSASPASLNNLLYRWLHPADYSMIRYSLPHLIDLAKGCEQILQLLSGYTDENPLEKELHRLSVLLAHPGIRRLIKQDNSRGLSYLTNLQLARITRSEYRSELAELVLLFYRFDAWYSMAKATQELNLRFPVFKDSIVPFLQVQQLTHIQLEDPVGYDLVLREKNRLLFLTGANMAGKSTLIKSIGVAVYLAHVGMGVPAKQMELSLFEGLLSNVTITDNLTKGESYFYNEVQRIKKTLDHMMDGRKWLVLIDELFKGTNVEDARRCSLAVIRGIVHLPNALTILSTHLYEIADSLREESGILYRYFETEVKPDALHFSYQLRDGVSQDRIGYRILEREGVTALLQKIQRNIGT